MVTRRARVIQQQQDQPDNRDKKPLWHAIALSVAAAIAALAGGGTFYIATEPTARPDAYTATMARADFDGVEKRFSTAIALKTEFNRARWDEIAKNMATQFAIIEALRISVENTAKQCAELSAITQSLSSDIVCLRDDNIRTDTMLWNHITNHTNKADFLAQ